MRISKQLKMQKAEILTLEPIQTPRILPIWYPRFICILHFRWGMCAKCINPYTEGCDPAQHLPRGNPLRPAYCRLATPDLQNALAR